eukprot:844291-Ditylum_brightwellii.AAC.1
MICSDAIVLPPRCFNRVELSQQYSCWCGGGVMVLNMQKCWRKRKRAIPPYVSAHRDSIKDSLPKAWLQPSI